MVVETHEQQPSHDQARIKCSVSEGVGRIVISNPARRNALSIKMWQDLADLFCRLSADNTLRCIVIEGAGQHFAAGADISEFPQHRHDEASVKHYHNNILAPALHAISTCPLPIIAKIRGACVGGGLEIASQCDLRIADSNARFGVPVNRLGFPMAPAEMLGLIRLTGPATALEILLEGRIFDADEALDKGLLTRVVSPDQLDEAVADSVRRIANGAPLAARINKETARRLSSNPAVLSSTELNALFRYAETRDHHEGVAAFLDGRAPQFSGE